MNSSSGSSEAPCLARAEDVEAERCTQDREEDEERSGGGLPMDGKRDMLVLADEDAIDAATDGRRDMVDVEG